MERKGSPFCRVRLCNPQKTRSCTHLWGAGHQAVMCAPACPFAIGKRLILAPHSLYVYQLITAVACLLHWRGWSLLTGWWCLVWLWAPTIETAGVGHLRGLLPARNMQGGCAFLSKGLMLDLSGLSLVLPPVTSNSSLVLLHTLNSFSNTNFLMVSSGRLMEGRSLVFTSCLSIHWASVTTAKVDVFFPA